MRSGTQKNTRLQKHLLTAAPHPTT